MTTELKLLSPSHVLVGSCFMQCSKGENFSLLLSPVGCKYLQRLLDATENTAIFLSLLRSLFQILFKQKSKNLVIHPRFAI